MMRVDVLVAGAGPIGLATAILAARAGFSVAVTDPREGPIDKACGEGLMPTALSQLHHLGLNPQGHDLAGITYVSAEGGHCVQAAFPDGPGRGVHRLELSSSLHRLAEELGIQRLGRRVNDVRQSDSYVEAAGVRARWLVAADGLHSPVRRLVGVEHRLRGPQRFGVRRHFEVSPWSSNVEVHWADASEAYVTPVAPHLVGVAILGARGTSFDDRMVQFPHLRELLHGAEGSAVLGAGPFLQGTTRRVAGRVLLVGDASGYIDALTGEGIAIGLSQARVLIEALVADEPEIYEANWQSATRRARLLTSTLMRVTQRPQMRRHLLPAAQRFPALFRHGVRLAS
jgi:flavin-dependent dehydrogenase